MAARVEETLATDVMVRELIEARARLDLLPEFGASAARSAINRRLPR